MKNKTPILQGIRTLCLLFGVLLVVPNEAQAQTTYRSYEHWVGVLDAPTATTASRREEYKRPGIIDYVTVVPKKSIKVRLLDGKGTVINEVWDPTKMKYPSGKSFWSYDLQEQDYIKGTMSIQLLFSNQTGTLTGVVGGWLQGVPGDTVSLNSLPSKVYLVKMR